MKVGVNGLHLIVDQKGTVFKFGCPYGSLACHMN